MSRSGWLLFAVVAGAAILGLSFVDAWIVHHRELSGEGYRQVSSVVNAWRSVALPLTSIGVVAAVVAAGASSAALFGWHRATQWVGPVASVLALGLLVATLVPVAQDGHASRIQLSAGWAAFTGAALAAGMAIVAVRIARPSPRRAIALAGLALLVLAAGVAGRWAALQAAAAPTEAWAVGSYTRSEAGQDALTLDVEDGRYRIGDRWSGGWESHSWTVILMDDPACPDARGAYHAHNVGPDGEDLRFVRVVDTCADGARAVDLETGTWERAP
jgi:hypothetical protein